MKWIETKAVFKSENKEIATDLISEEFYKIGIKGVAIEDPDFDRSEGLWQAKPELPERDAVTAYVAKNELTAVKLATLEKGIRDLEAFGIECAVECREIDEQDWAEAWKTYFWPEKIGGRLVVKPTWRTYDPEPGDIVIEIDPGMAFGTGTHPTTALCANMMEKWLEPGHTFLDVGTGSGILMIAAAKLGAAKVRGVDTDETAVQIALKNLSANGLDPNGYAVETGDLIAGIDEKYDFVAANILSEVISVLLDSIENALSPGGLFVCSGIIEENERMISEKMVSMGFDIIETMRRESWVAIAGKL